MSKSRLPEDYAEEILKILPTKSETTRIEVLPLKTKTWVRRDDWVINYPVFYNLEEDKMIFCNGALHWLALDDDYKFVAGFDLAEQKVLFLPLRGSRNAFTTRIGVLGGELYNGVSSPSCAEVWVMKEYGVESSWTDLGRVEESGVSIDNFEPLALSEDGDVIGLVSAHESHGESQSYKRNILKCQLNDMSKLTGDDDQTLRSLIYEQGSFSIRGIATYIATSICMRINSSFFFETRY